MSTSTPIAGKEVIIPGASPHNCGGRCLMKAHVVDGVITRFDADDRPDHNINDRDMPQLRACQRCRGYLGRLYHPGRLKYPLKQTKERGDVSGFIRINWDEALDLLADELKRVKNEYGNEAIYLKPWSGYPGALHGNGPLTSLMNHFGGFLGFYGNPSSHQYSHMMPFITGQPGLTATPDTLMHSKLIILWGSNFAETIMNTNTAWYMTRAKEAGAQFVYIGPYKNDTCATYADTWIPIKPGTDTAMMLAMMYVMIDENLLDREYLANFVHGFYDDADHDIPAGRSLSAYVLGNESTLVDQGVNSATSTYPGEGDYVRYPYKSITKTPKTPEWASEICCVNAEVIRQLARQYSDRLKPAYIHFGLGVQRQTEGCQQMYAMHALTAITGQWGKQGTGIGILYSSTKGAIPLSGFPVPPNPVEKAIPCMMWTDAVRNPGRSEWGNGDINSLMVGIKLIVNFASNNLINQHMDINRTRAMLKDRSLVEFICGIDNFLIPSLRYADLVLPGATNWEQNDLIAAPGSGDSVIFANKAVEPPGEAKTSYEIFSRLADRLGIGEELTQGKTEEDWLREMWKSSGEPISYEELKKRGIYVFNGDKPALIASSKIRGNGAIDPDDERLRFNTTESGDCTRSGKIHVFSSALVHEYENRGAGQANKDADGDPIVYPIPMYFPASDENATAVTAEFPFTVLTPHNRYSAHSTHLNNPYMRELNKYDSQGRNAYDADSFGTDPQQIQYGRDTMPEVWINGADAEANGIEHRDVVKIYNEKGTVRASAKVTQRVMPGVLILYQGSWFDPDDTGVDLGGSANTLTTEQPSRIDHGNAQMAAHAAIEKKT